MAAKTKTKTHSRPTDTDEAVNTVKAVKAVKAAASVADPPSSPPTLDSEQALPSPAPKKRKAAVAATSATLPEIEVDLSLPEPPSKRARRALKKGKPLPSKPASDEDDNDEDNDNDKNNAGTDAAGSLKKTPRSAFGIWIGNLPFTLTRTQLFRWFVDNAGGAIADDAITRVNLPLASKRDRPQTTDTPNRRANKGFAYVDFATYEAQVAAVALSETALDGRRVLIKDSKSFAGRPAPAVRAVGADTDIRTQDGGKTAPAPTLGTTSTKIFVGNLGFDTTEEDLRRHFAPCGPIAWAKVATFADNMDKCRGYGWVQFGGAAVTPTTAVHSTGTSTPTALAEEAATAAVRGFVRIRETVDTEEDFAAEASAQKDDDDDDDEDDDDDDNDDDDNDDDDNDDDDDDDDDDDATAATPKTESRPTRTRKWYVNRLKGRQLKIQFAEDDRVRYKKRFGKERAQDRHPQRPSGDLSNKQRRDGDGDNSRADTDATTTDKPYKYQDLDIARRTGAITASLGKKIVFD